MAKWLRIFHGLGCRDVILQWAVHDGAPVLSGPEFSGMLDTAAQLGLRVTIGLPYQSGYWTVLSEGDRTVRTAFLEHALEQGKAFIEACAERRHPAVSGFYVPYEIDQHSWAAAPDRRLLAGFLAKLADAAGAQAPLAVSTFHSELPAETDLAHLWDGLLGKAPVRPMVQDGAGKMGVSNYAHLDSLFVLLSARGQPFDVVVELFTHRIEGEENVFSAAGLPRIRKQLTAAAQSGAERLIGFAIYPYMDDTNPAGRELHRAYGKAIG